MITFNKPKDLQQFLANLMKRLQAIINSNWPSDPDKNNVHAIKVEAAKRYLAEVQSLDQVLCPLGEVHVLDKKSFDTRLNKADIAVIVDEGEFFRLAEIANFPNSQYLAICFTPLNSL